MQLFLLHGRQCGEIFFLQGFPARPEVPLGLSPPNRSLENRILRAVLFDVGGEIPVICIDRIVLNDITARVLVAFVCKGQTSAPCAIAGLRVLGKHMQPPCDFNSRGAWGAAVLLALSRPPSACFHLDADPRRLKQICLSSQASPPVLPA
jgi:hypothetical protein